MQGKIVVYSDQTGIGKIITPEHKKYNFTIDEWNEYETIPQIGQTITFDPEGIDAKNILLSSADAPPRTPAPTVEERFAPHTNDETPLETSKEEPVEEDYGLEPSVDVDTAIQLHFSDIQKRISDNKELIKENRKLDFIRMNRFLTTAYNNLIEIDHGFENHALTELRIELLEAYEAYQNFKSKTSYLQNAYEDVFLSKQIRYKELRAKLELNKTQIANLNENATKREIEIKEKSGKLAALGSQSDEYIYLSNEIKILKRTMVDAIHEVAKLNEENRLYIDLLDNFYKMHYERFKASFEEFVQTHDSLLRKIQDVLAYRFDALIWQKANCSKPIQNFFVQAGIADEFSSITYLKYYLKTLDASKLNRQNKELMDLLQYLEQQAKKKIVCIDDDTEFLGMVREVVGEIDREIKVTLTTRPEATLPDLKNIQPNILIINPDMRNIHIEALLEYARKIVPEIEVAFFAKRISRELLLQAKRYNVAAIIPKSVHKQELLEQFKQYID
ncbi:hypothetical protein [Hydrogenimonas cancrithermarum]|uniref:Response regulatory domain-containing protein n=1 Tax=Hydrogenimonas cancrithermarum TaxID=2993563 RepID=A0ABM8FMQ5_9BACT|nr:hypothetical protein [Hydrogenimonas cancrithermarum]BDY12789.1 hypothetical protein HCR_11010 [Hydrogenimonas cancrithermarum]